MNLHAPPDAPLILRFGADALLFLHIAGGTVGMVSGATAMLAKKGQRLHRIAGNVFTVGMLTMAGIGAAVAPFLNEDQWTNTTAAVFTLYLVSTAWTAGKRRDGEAGRFERTAMFVPVGIAAMAVSVVFFFAGKTPPEDFATVYVFGLLSAVAVAGDLNLIGKGGLSGSSRVARHVWRMTFALFVAMGSFFFGQQKFLPEAIQGTFIPAIPVLSMLALGAYGFVRTRFAGAFRRRPRSQPLAA
jgi:uncharacterized membrane protein